MRDLADPSVGAFYRHDSPYTYFTSAELHLGEISLETWAGVIYLGVLGSVVSYILYLWALRYMTPAGLGAVSYLQPVGAMLLGLALLGEPITRRVAFGGLLIIAGVYAIETHGREPQAKLA